eukprot:CAMPEP_0201572684 /NCGR_PEP_ID=MMETSP0190_2-20130828/16110_1 /ASSEMBLY_ACC=CAM_ASM_000263 /TAXON_ID=37353 /ORGANISM="Rosalina sp." /LENGTH=46 /DNA_ID= /DNA_START= /DNA_END= /DNA_ORIENTATION=
MEEVSSKMLLTRLGGGGFIALLPAMVDGNVDWELKEAMFGEFVRKI